MLIVGDREQEGDVVSVRAHRSGDVGGESIEQFAARVANDVRTRSAG
jgi:threonyl-tRNA synthetase